MFYCNYPSFARVASSALRARVSCFFSCTFVFFSENVRHLVSSASAVASAASATRRPSAGSAPRARSNASLSLRNRRSVFPAGSPRGTEVAVASSNAARFKSRFARAKRRLAPPRRGELEARRVALARQLRELAARRDAPMRLCACAPVLRRSRSRPARVALGRHRPERGEHGRARRSPSASASASPDADPESASESDSAAAPPTSSADASGVLGERGRPAAAPARSASRSAARVSRSAARASASSAATSEAPAAASSKLPAKLGATRGRAAPSPSTTRRAEPA